MSKFIQLVEETLKEFKKKSDKNSYSLDAYYQDKADQDKYNQEDLEDDEAKERDSEWNKFLQDQEAGSEEDYSSIDKDYKFTLPSFDKEEFYNQFVQSQQNKHIYQWLIKCDDEEGYYPESLYNELADSEFRIEIVDMQYVRVNGHKIKVYTVHEAKYDKLNWPIKIVKVPLDYNWEAIFQQSFLDDISYTSNKTALPVMLDKFSEVISEHYPTLLVTVNADFDVNDDYNGLYR